MMRTTRRGAMIGALAVPTMGGLSGCSWSFGEGSVLLHDPSLEVGLRFAEAGKAASRKVLAIEGDPIRTLQSVLPDEPAVIAGISRHADALLIEEAAGEGGYIRVAAVDAQDARCTVTYCRPGWHGFCELVLGAGEGWVEALASYAASAGWGGQAPPVTRSRRGDPGRVFGWVLAPR